MCAYLQDSSVRPEHKLADPAPLRARLMQVIAQHQRGDTAAAIRGYREVLDLDSRQFDALRLLGVALRSHGQLEPALAMFERAIEVRADFAEVWFLRGETLEQLGRIDEALPCLERALILRPDYAVAWNALGSQHHLRGRHDAALHAFDCALAAHPGSAAVWSNRALTLAATSRWAEALEHYERAIELEPGVADLWVNRAKTLHDLGRHDAALASLDRSLELDPNLPAAWASRAAPLRALGRLEQALQDNERALELDPSFVMAWTNRGTALAEMGRHEEAAASFEHATAIDPQDRATRFRLGVLHLMLGRLAQGWEGYESRDLVSGMVAQDAPIWEAGESLAGKRIALHCEQGLGDTLQFCRYAPLLAQRGARVLLVVPPALHRLVSSVDVSQERVRVLTTGDPMPPFDRQCNLMSVAHRLGTTLETIPAKVPYVQPPAARIRHWRRRLLASATGMNWANGQKRPRRVGLVFSGNPAHDNDRYRSLPLERMAGLIESMPKDAVEWHLLQKDVRAQDEPWIERLGIVDHRAALGDFCETAGLILCLDAVVSVDTSVAHLAGALGRPLFVLLAANPDWRWMLHRDDSPWYPSARLLRQGTLGDWTAPLMQLQELLSADANSGVEGGFEPSCKAELVNFAGLAGDAAVPLAPTQDWREDEPLADLLRAARAAPSDPNAQFNLGLRYLTLGRFDPGWDYYEWRLRVPKLYTPMPQGGLYWDGSQSLGGKTLLLCHEQGLGDAIQFCRYVPLLAAHGAKVLIGVPQPLARLLQGLPGVARVIGASESIPRFDFKCLLLSVAQRFGASEETIPGRTPYLAAPAKSEQAWRHRLDDLSGGRRRFRVGLVVSGNPGHVADAQRSIALAQLAPLRQSLGDTDWEWHLVQRDLRESDAQELACSPIADHREQLLDLAETAALISVLDAVVCVDTAVAHLAGALGVPVLILLAKEADWRWMLDRDDSPWYPSARLVRQQHAGDWTEPIARLETALRALYRGSSLERLPRRSVAPRSPSRPVSLRRCAVIQPDLAAMLAAAAQRHRQGDRASAIAVYQDIVAHDPQLFDAQRLLGAALLQESRAAEAIPVLEKAQALRADCTEVWIVHANALAQIGHLEEALVSIDRALALSPENAQIWGHRAKVCNDLGRSAEVLASLERAVQLAPSQALAQYQRGMVRLQQGDMPGAWADFEARLRVAELATRPLGGIPVWTGSEPLAGKTLLLTCEQGLGDTIQFCRYATALAARGARPVLGVQPALRNLLGSIPGVAAAVTNGDRLPALDLQCTLLSVPHHVGTTLLSIPAMTPYLQAPAQRVSAWRRRLDSLGHAAGDAARSHGRRRVGLICSGNAHHVNDLHRSMPLERMTTLIGLPIEWHLLQTDLRSRDEPWLQRLGIADHRAALSDFCETAALMQCLDAVVSVDTSAAHLAGALGVPLYLLLPANPDWRWMMNRDDSPWYPSARLLRQRILDDWSEPLARLREFLQS